MTDEVRLETATDADIDRLMSLEREAFSHPWTEASVLRELYDKDSLFLVAKQYDNAQAEPQILGFAITRMGEDYAELLQIAVSESARRRGIASLLLTETLNRVSARAIPRVLLETRVSNDGAIALYERFGFRRIATRRGYYDAPVEDAAIFQLKVTQC
ncbi:MAG: ribosomal protein S18-alanine N-acetyltransferase [Oscillospiraceae bacterium]|jgi:ribosomal-protein-alanine N-acetyltransferase|nr:ribosomal protein S18-alanine N-acetyltransferase [Oscillospiraceae bacterium]